MSGRPFALSVDVRKSGASFKSVLPLHLLCRKLFSASVTTAAKNVSARLGAHSLAEAVNFVSLSFLGLVGLLHILFLRDLQR